MKTYLGYIRVSTARQGERGVSLQEQKDAIERYAARNSLAVSRWFEERETAAKRGRPLFMEMLKLLRSGSAAGVLIHKIDRSARNMKDWAELGELIDQGVEVRFVNESLDLASRGGRLSADIQAVVAADYIRNLREESRKGFYGRVKQGLFPLSAPLGYRDMGKGMPKAFDPLRAPLVKHAFVSYATGTKTLETLHAELYRLGLRNRNGGPVSVNGLSTILNNPFYFGLIRLGSTGEIFPGRHEPLIPKSLFDRVQAVLRGKIAAKTQKHDFMFRKMLLCESCHYSLYGELQKGHVYYRCHTRGCPTTSVREEAVEEACEAALAPLAFGKDEQAILLEKLRRYHAEIATQWETEANAVRLQLGQLTERLDRLTDAYLDRLVGRESFEERKGALLGKQKSLEEALRQPKGAALAKVVTFLELAGCASRLYREALPEEKRLLLRSLTSNRSVSQENIAITLKFPFQDVANRSNSSNGRPSQGRPRTWDRLLGKLIAWFAENPAESFEISAIANRDETTGVAA